MRASHPAPGRLTRRPEFLAAATGRRFHTERMTLQGRRRDGDEPAADLRVGLTVTKRVGHATERNRIRRRLRSAAAEAVAAFGAAPLDVVVVGRRDVLGAPYALLVEDLARGLRIVSKPPSSKPPAPKPSSTQPKSSPHGDVPAAEPQPRPRT